MGAGADAAVALAQAKGWPLEKVNGPQFTLWMRGKQRADWLVIGAHGCSEHERDVNVPNLHATKIYFLTQRLAAAPGNPDSWYVNRALEGGRWSTTTTDWVEAGDDEWRFVPTTKSGLVEVFDTTERQRPFDYRLIKYKEDRQIKTITDMYEGGAREPFDAITLSKMGTTLSEVLTWLSERQEYRYPNIVAGFCNSSSYTKFMTPFGDYVPKKVYDPDRVKALPPLPQRPPRRALPMPPRPLPPRPPAASADGNAAVSPRLPHGGPPRKK